MHLKLEDGTEYELEIEYSGVDSFFYRGGIKPVGGEWRDMTDDELDKAQDMFSDELYQDITEHYGYGPK